MQNEAQYWHSVSTYLNSNLLVEELAAILQDNPVALDDILERFEGLKSLHSLHSFILKACRPANNDISNRFERGNVADLFARSIGVQLNNMEFEDLRLCFNSYVE